MTYDGSLRFDTRIDERGFNRGTESMSRSIKKLGILITAAFSVREIIKFGNSALSIASDLIEVQNVVDVVFENMASNINEFATTTIERFGMSELAAKQFTGTLGAMGKAAGINAKDNLAMSKSITGLIGDYASFYNISLDIAATNLKSIYTGETESLRMRGIVMTQAALQEFALSRGIEKTIKQMSEREKVMLRYNFVLSKSGDAIGDFARTSDSWANQIRILSERWKQFLGLIGNNLIRIFTPVVQILNSVVNSLISATREFNRFYAAITGNQIEVKSGIDSSIDSQNSFTDSIKKSNKELHKSVAGFDDINILQKDIAGIQTIGGAGESFEIDATNKGIKADKEVKENSKIYDSLMRIYEAMQLIKKNFIDLGKNETILKIKVRFNEFKNEIGVKIKEMKESFNAFVVDISPKVEELKDKVGGIFDRISEDAGPLLNGFIKLVFTTMSYFVGLFGSMFSALFTDIIMPVFGLIFDFIDGMLEIIFQLWAENGNDILENVTGFYTTLMKFITTVYKTILKPIIERILKVIKFLWEEHFKDLIYQVGSFVLALVDAVLKIYNGFILPLVTLLVKVLGPTFVNIIKFIIDVIGTFVGFLADVASGILRMLTGIIKFIVGVFTLDWEKAWEGIGDFFYGIFDVIASVFKGVINLIIDGMNFMVRQLNKVQIKVPDWVPGFKNKKTFGFDIKELDKLKDIDIRTNSKVPPSVQYNERVRGETLAQKQGETETNVTIKFEGDFAAMARIMKPSLDEESKRLGQKMKVVTE